VAVIVSYSAPLVNIGLDLRGNGLAFMLV